MVYITSWDEFVDRSIQLFRADPISSRYVMKYRHCDGKLVLKVTDNRESPQKIVSILSLEGRQQCYGLYGHTKNCLKFKTDQAQDAKKMEKLNNIFFILMTKGPDADITEVTSKEQGEAQPPKRGRGRKQ